ncbi:MAG: hypothetical protein ACOYXA_14360 [Bacteroidota bacterium]
MAHGKAIDLATARANIRKFVVDEMARTHKPEKDIIVGHRFDLSLVKDFMLEIDKLLISKVPIDSIRIYLAKSSRNEVQDGYDLVIVPTLANGDDYHIVYPRPQALTASMDPIILSMSTPCPNVCQNKAVSCP